MGAWGEVSASTSGAMGAGEHLSDMPKPFSDALGSCTKLPARDPMLQLLARQTFGLAELPADLVGWMSVALAHGHGVLHLCEQLCEIVLVVSNLCRLVGCSTGDLVFSRKVAQ